MNILEKLKEEGWYLTEEGLKKLTIINNLETEDFNKVISLARNYDFKDIAAGALPSKIDSNGSIRGRIVLQIQKLRNISAPKANEESTVAPRFLQLELSDGVNTVSALEFERIANLNLNIPPGTKLFIKSEKVAILNGFVILKASDVQILGGKVEALVEKWELARQMLKYAKSNRRISGSGGPPPWIAFGKRLDVHKDELSSDKHFKSLQIANDKDKASKENDEFNASRTQAIAEASKAGQKKVFGGGQQNILDHNVKKILEKGYSEEEAKQALKTNNNNLERTLYNLKRKNNSKTSASENAAKSVSVSASRIREKCGVSTKEESVTAKPQANVSLFDFLTDKLPATISSETAVKNANKEHVSKGEFSVQSQNAKAAYCGGNKFENNMSSSFAANKANNPAKSDDRQIVQTRAHNFNRKQDESNLPLSNRSAKVGDRTNSRTKSQVSNNIKIQNKAPPPVHDEKLNLAGSYNSKRNERTFKKERGPRQPINDYSTNKRTKGNKIAEQKYPPARDANRNSQDLKNNTFQQKQTTKTSNYENDLDNLVNSTSKLTIQNNRDLPSNTQPNIEKSQQYNTGSSNSQQMPKQFNKSEHCPNNYQQKSSKPSDPHNISSKSFTHNTKLSGYSPQVGNGFVYDPSKIVGFQSKEANEYAINILKSQGMTMQQTEQHQTVSPQTKQSTQITQSPPQHATSQVPNQTSTSINFITPSTNVYVTQPQQATSQFGMLSGKNWPWKEGDLCLAKYWDDGNFYNAKITAISEKTCVVLFLGYGNHEEVLKSDCVPITDTQHLSLGPFQTSIAVPSVSQPPQQKSNMHSGIGGGNQRYRSERQMYVPPPKRTNN